MKILSLKLGVKRTRELKKIDFSAHFYFAQLFVLFSALSIIFFTHFQQKYLPIHWLKLMCTARKETRVNKRERGGGGGGGGGGDQNSGIFSERTF